jgi:hypothetical protein
MSAADSEAHPRRGARRRWRPFVALAAVLLLAGVLAACGSSSGSGSTGTGTTNSASTTKQGAAAAQTGSRSSRFTALRSCLQKAGINLPSRSPGSSGQPGNGGAPGGGFKLPEGVSRTKFEEAIRKCGGGAFKGGRFGFDSATAKAALSKYSACMRENGVNLPTPNTSGNGPVFDTKGLNTSSESFKNAEKKCQTDLKGAFGGRRAPGGAAGGGSPPAGGAGAPAAGGYGPPPRSAGEGA